MAFISEIGEAAAFFVGKRLEAISSDSKRWFAVAGFVGGWAVGFFYAARAVVTRPQALALMAVCSYALARFGTDTHTVINMLAKWLLAHGGDEGQKYLLSLSVEAYETSPL